MIPLYPQQNGIAVVAALSPAAWFRYGMGQTVTGSGVSQWDDQSGNGRHLKQGTDTNRPALQADGSILFDGVDNFLKCDAFTLNQPESVYILFQQATWTSGDVVFDGNSASTGAVLQAGSTPRLDIFAGTEVAGPSTLALGSYGVITAVFNGGLSVIQRNNDSPITGVAGSNNMGGFALGARGDNLAFSNIQVKEVIIFSAAHDAATRTRVIRYLASVGGLAV